MNISLFEIDAYERSYLEEHLKGHSLIFSENPIQDENIKRFLNTEVLAVFIYSKLTKEILQNFPFLKLIVTMSTGYDHIDLDYCRHAGIVVCNVPKYGGSSVAEQTFALMLALLRHIPKAVNNTIHDDFSLEGLMGRELYGKTLGVIGAGNIGNSVIRIAQAFGMHILVYTKHKYKPVYGEKEVILPELLKKSDIITLHVPLTPETRHILNRRTISMIKKGAYIINTARGDLIETDALLNALDKGNIAGAALDVLEGEADLKEPHQAKKRQHHSQHDWKRLRENHALLKKKNVIITPHMSFFTKESEDVILRTTVENIRSFEKRKPINNILILNNIK